MQQDRTVYRLDSIGAFHRALGLPAPRHPLISLVNNANNVLGLRKLPPYEVLGFYKITCITGASGRFRYGQGHYDFEASSMLFLAPNQVVGAEYTREKQANEAGYALLIHPDFLQGSALAGKIKQYGYFSYALHEALHLSEQEKATVLTIFSLLEVELSGRLDESSHQVLLAQLELLLSYANRFYERQFITRRAVSSSLLQKLETLLDSYFQDEQALRQGLPTVSYLAESLALSPRYLSDMLRSLTGLSAQQHIHEKLLEKAKEKLSTTTLSVSEVAYQLGFEHPQSFSKLFKTKTSLSPTTFRDAFGAP